MATYANKAPVQSAKLEAEVIANKVGLGIRAVGTESKAVGRGFWNGLLGNVATPDAAPTDAVPSIDDIATMVAAKVLDAQAAKAKRS